jgi:arylsulfatase
VDEKQAKQGRIEWTIPVRFSLDETFDIGEDTGTPVLEEYADQMPYRFTGTLKRFVVVLEPLKLSADEQRRLHAELAKAMAAVQ